MRTLIDLRGQRFEFLTVLGRADNSKLGATCWKCLCDCGNETVVFGSNLKKGNTKSCGCLRGDQFNANECISIVRMNCGIVVPGNHDLYAGKRVPLFTTGFDYTEDTNTTIIISSPVIISGQKLIIDYYTS